MYQVLPTKKGGIDESIQAGAICMTKLKSEVDTNHWRCLNDSMWSEHLPVQVVAWRMLSRLRNHELLDQMYLDDDVLVWAQATGEGEDDEK